MVYPRELLQSGEEVVLDRVPHWSYMMGPIFMLSVSVITTIVLAFFNPIFLAIGAICVLITGLGTFGSYLRWRNTNFVVTNERLITRTGIFAKSGLEIPLDRVTNISYHQTLVERCLGAGDLVVESAGETGQQRFTNVATPQKVQNVIYQQAEIAERANYAHDGSGGHHEQSIPEQIEQLDGLRQRGVLSKKEFEEKKRELLERM